MSTLLSEVFAGGIYAFMMVFTRIGSAIMIMPGAGDSFVPAPVRLWFALGLSFILTPLAMSFLPPQPAGTFAFLSLLVFEAVTGIFMGTVARVLISALDTAGMVVSLQSGLSNAQIFNPVAGSQGSVTGALLAVSGTVLLFASDMHHMLITSLLKSYALFPAGVVPSSGGMAEVMSRTVSSAFGLGVQLAFPFVVIGLVVYTAFGLVGRLLPQIQIFFLALPVQIVISMVTLVLVFSTIMLYWLSRFETGYISFLGF